jgi:GT2 family glycosyltransferase
MSTSVIVPTYNRPSALARTLQALRASDFPQGQLEIIVVDSGPDSRENEAAARATGAQYVQRPNDGVSAARNQGARLASGELLLFVDDDIVVAPSNVRRHLAIHESDGRCLVSGRWEFDPQLRRELESSPLGRFRLHYEDLYNVPHGVVGDGHGRVHPQTLAAANLSIRRDVFWSLDGFDERFPVGAEDQDFSWRAAQEGCALIYDFDIQVIHNDQHTDLKALCNRLQRSAAGTVYFARKHPETGTPAMLDANGPVRRGDSARIVVRKLSRDVLSRRVPLALAHRLVRFVERLRPDGGNALEFLYRAIGGLYVFRGVRRGLRLTEGEQWASAHGAV